MGLQEGGGEGAWNKGVLNREAARGFAQGPTQATAERDGGRGEDVSPGDKTECKPAGRRKVPPTTTTTTPPQEKSWGADKKL